MSNFNTTFKSVAANAATQSNKIGIAVSRSGAVVLDEYFYTDENFIDKRTPEMAKFLVATTAGVLVYQYFDGTYGVIDSALAGFWYPLMAVRVVTSHTFNNGGLKTTTASGINWFGGW